MVDFLVLPVQTEAAKVPKKTRRTVTSTGTRSVEIGVSTSSVSMRSTVLALVSLLGVPP